MRSRRTLLSIVGVTAVLLTSVALAGTAQAAPPGNDAFASATLLGASGSLTGSNVDATAEAGEPDPGATGDGADASVWYRWTAPADGTLVVSTFGSDFDTVVGIYTGNAVNALVTLTEGDDTDDGVTTRVTTEVDAGQQYRIAVAGYEAGDEGTIKLAWRLAQAPTNDDFAQAVAIGGAGGVVSGSNVAATAEVDEPGHEGAPAEHSVWYRWTAPSSGLATFDVLDADFDSTLVVYTGATLAALSELTSNDDFGPLYRDSRVALPVTAGTTYRIAVEGYDGTFGREVGSFSFGVNRVSFSDVSRTHPFWQSIGWVSGSGVANGYTDGTFRPSASITRAAMSAFLYRLDGNLPEDFTPPGTPTFSDVPTSHPFYREIEWMADQGISTGYDDDTYRPSSSVTRGAMSAFLYRFSGDTFMAPAEATFSDVPTNHPFFLEIEWMNDETITTGYGDGTFRPGVAVSRGAMAAFLDRFYNGPINI